jgi:hypothetical protein
VVYPGGKDVISDNSYLPWAVDQVFPVAGVALVGKVVAGVREGDHHESRACQRQGRIVVARERTTEGRILPFLYGPVVGFLPCPQSAPIRARHG